MNCPQILQKSFKESAATVTVAPSAAAAAAAMSESEQEKDWTYATALLFCVAVITSIGYGDIVPRTPEGKVACMFYGLVGIPMMLLCLANIGHFLATCFRFVWHQARTLCLVKDKDKDKTDGFRDCKARVPITVILLTLFIYLMTGASLFSGWEGWSFLDGCYFVFVTLSTIGFGDLVPGKGTNTLDSNAQRVVCALYLLFGLSLVAMTFQLIQDWVRHIMARYAEFFGLTKEQIDKDKEISETGILDASVEDEENRRKLLGNNSPGPGGAAGCSGVVVIGNDSKNGQQKHRQAEDAEAVSVAEVRDPLLLNRSTSNESSIGDGPGGQETPRHKGQGKLTADVEEGESNETGPNQQQPPPSVEEASNTLLGLLKKRRSPQDKTGDQLPNSDNLSRDGNNNDDYDDNYDDDDHDDDHGDDGGDGDDIPSESDDFQ
ncbi:potassium channel subfamily K member 4 [Elysia marginata]|uniref:Potassium channel subfamily K member 4 n=1 Tax=Elysia marginata TaxID=1093978 RepID=A0AAV4EJ24_9GAST|nr:potassium channel subfamily K member 4 [Elysia marginata]